MRYYNLHIVVSGYASKGNASCHILKSG